MNPICRHSWASRQNPKGFLSRHPPGQPSTQADRALHSWHSMGRHRIVLEVFIKAVSRTGFKGTAAGSL